MGSDHPGDPVFRSYQQAIALSEQDSTAVLNVERAATYRNESAAEIETDL